VVPPHLVQDQEPEFPALGTTKKKMVEPLLLLGAEDAEAVVLKSMLL
jgi:hypothetical protein